MGRVLTMRGVLLCCVYTLFCARGCNLRGKLHPLHGLKNGQTTFAPSLLVTWCICPRPRWLGAGGALTVLRFAPLAQLRPVLGYNARLERVPGSCVERCRL
jgi:hypothetical protein